MLNIDSEKEDELTVACAGGLRVYANWQVAYTEIGDKEQYVVTVYGLKGGHSGVEIGLGRANANKLLCELPVSYTHLTGKRWKLLCADRNRR